MACRVHDALPLATNVGFKARLLTLVLKSSLGKSAMLRSMAPSWRELFLSFEIMLESLLPRRNSCYSPKGYLVKIASQLACLVTTQSQSNERLSLRGVPVSTLVHVMRCCEELHAISWRASHRKEAMRKEELGNFCEALADLTESLEVFVHVTPDIANQLRHMMSVLADADVLLEWLRDPASAVAVRRLHSALAGVVG